MANVNRHSAKHSLSVIILSAAMSVVMSPAYANQVGVACPGTAGQTQTLQSDIPQEGILACLKDGNGNYFWQPTNGGMPRYDATYNCSLPGQIRWNGSVMQYCDGANWQPFGSLSCRDVTASTGARSVTATCSAGESMTGGGCQGTGYPYGGYPSGPASYTCSYALDGTIAHVICCH